LPTKEERMLRTSLALKVAAGVLGAAVVGGGGYALGTNVSAPSGNPGAVCETRHNDPGEHGRDADHNDEHGKDCPAVKKTEAPDSDQARESNNHGKTDEQKPQPTPSGTDAGSPS
jgi:hypothetical protein